MLFKSAAFSAKLRGIHLTVHRRKGGRSSHKGVHLSKQHLVSQEFILPGFGIELFGERKWLGGLLNVEMAVVNF